MPTVHFTRHLESFFPGLGTQEVPGESVAEVLGVLNVRYPGLAAYILDEHGALRKHVNVFVDESMVHDRMRLSDAVGPGTRIHVLQALSGG
ncbi:MAG: MoaD/ThiS family protein [Pseudomonadota bacterium]|nr:MoaD/ThiS family protein [Pseudomonadota bacterium]